MVLGLRAYWFFRSGVTGFWYGDSEAKEQTDTINDREQDVLVRIPKLGTVQQHSLLTEA